MAEKGYFELKGGFWLHSGVRARDPSGVPPQGLLNRGALNDVPDLVNRGSPFPTPSEASKT